MDIIVVDPNGNQREYNIEAFQKEVVSFGRQPDNDIVFNYDFVSRVHGVIYREGMQYYIEDMNSTNGIYVNGSRTKRAKLNMGDSIVLARSFQDGSRIEISVGDKVVAQQPYVQPYQQPVYADANANAAYGNYMLQQPMAWYKFVIYFSCFFLHLYVECLHLWHFLLFQICRIQNRICNIGNGQMVCLTAIRIALILL